MKPPIFLWQPDDLIVFESAQIAERFVEGDTEGHLFDSEGRRLRFNVVEEVRKHPYVVLALRQEEDEPTHQAVLMDALRQALRASGDPDGLDHLSLEDLVDRTVVRFGFAH